MKEPTTDPASGAGAVQGKAVGEHDFTALPVGSRIGRYQITAILGQGGFGITYRARDEQLGREVAIKEYLPSALAVRHDGHSVLPRSTKVAEDFGWGRERFVSEGRTLASLHDAPAIVRVFDFMEANGTAYIVMELVRGDTLEARLKQTGKLGPDEVDAILWPLLDGLEQVHAAGFLHRDIKPANILMRPDGKPTLIDFGASRAAMAGRTTAMTAIFTPGYAAAEQFTSAKQGPWTDIYGLSATLYHAITGSAPPSAFDRMLDDEYQPLARLAPAQIRGGFKPGLLIGLDAGLAVRAGERPQSIAGWRPLLAQAGAITGDATVALGRQPDPNVTVAAARPPADPSPAPPPPAVPSKSRVGLYAAAVAVVLLLVGGGWFMVGDRSSPQTVALQDMKVEELEKVLEQRRKAEAEAAEKRRAEEEAKRQAEADAASKRAADDELAKAEAQRKKAEEELARLREELEAQRKAAAEQRELADAQAKRIAAEEARRKVEAEMAALRAAEEEARRKAAIEAEAKKLADEALARAQAEREKAEQDAKAKAAAEEKSKKDSDERTRKEAEARAREQEKKEQAEAEAKEKAEKEAKAAEAALKLTRTDRQRLRVALTSLGFRTDGSDAAFGTRTRQAIAAWQKSRNEPETGFLTAAQQQAILKDAAPAVARFDDEQKKLEAEAAETALKLTTVDRQRLQVALTSLGHNTGGSDGTFGPRSRQAIAGWQKSRNEPETGFLTAAQQQALLKDAAPAVTKFDDEQKKLEEEAKAKAVFDGSYGGALAIDGSILPTTVQVTNGVGRGTYGHPRCGQHAFTFRIGPNGEVSGSGQRSMSDCTRVEATVGGRAANKQLQLVVIASAGPNLTGTLTLGAAAPPMAAAAPAPSPAQATAVAPPATSGGVNPYDGRWSGMATLGGGSNSHPLSATLQGGRGKGSWYNPRCGGDVTYDIIIEPDGKFLVTLSGYDGNCVKGTNRFTGTVQGSTLRFSFARGQNTFTISR